MTLIPVRNLMISASLAALLPLCGALAADDAPSYTAEEIAAIHAEAITIDTHVDIPLDFATESFDPASTDAPLSQVDLERMTAGGLDAVFFVVYSPQDKLTPSRYAKAMETAFRRFSAIRRMTDELYPDRIGLALTAADIRRLNKEGKSVALIGIENGYPMGENLGLLDTFYSLGGRYLGLVHNGHNQLSDSAQPREALGDAQNKHGGLSDLGRATVDRCNELGIMIDVSHASKAATLEILARSKAPVIASHSSVDGVLDHARNLSDEELLAFRKNGGVVQIVAFDSYLKPVPDDKRAAITSLRAELGLDRPGAFGTATPETLMAYRKGLGEIAETWPGADLSDLVAHVDYAVSVMGIDHVGISSDFQGGGGIAGWRDAADTLNVTKALLERGYTPEQVGKIWGGNLLRVMEDAEAYAAQAGG